MAEGEADAPVVITCEHASERLPEGWSWPEQDERLRGTHWSHDLGALELTLELAEALAAPAVLSRFSRLLADANRPEDHPDLFRERAEGLPVALNADVPEAERARRLGEYHRPFHAAIDRALAFSRAHTVFSIHTFTPNYEGELRDVEVGVLFNRDEEPAARLRDALRRDLAEVRDNEPWSGKAGLIWSPEHHAESHGRVCLEIEVRQDLAQDAGYRLGLVELLVKHFRG